MNIKSLRSFVNLGDNDCDFGIHKEMGVPRSTLWTHVTELEKETGLRLVVRRKQNNLMTEEGKNFLPYARRLLKLFEEGVNQAKDCNGDTPSGEVTIATTAAVANGWMMSSIRSFRELFPQVQLKIIADDRIGTSTEMIADVILRPMPERDFLTRRWYIEHTMCLMASPEYLKQYGVPQTPADLILGYGEYAFSHFADIDWHLKGRWPGFPRLAPSLMINSTFSLYRAVEEGLGIGSVALESPLLYGGQVQRVLPEISGPKILTHFCVKKDLSTKMQRNIHFFETFFTQYLNQIGVVVKYEPKAAA